MGLVIPSLGTEFTAVIAETITHRDAFIVQRIGQATVDAALQEREMEMQMAETLSDEEFKGSLGQLAPFEDLTEETPLLKYDRAVDEAVARLRGLFEIIGGYRLGFVNPGKVELDRGYTWDPSGMTTLTLTTPNMKDILVDKTVSTSSINPPCRPTTPITLNLGTTTRDGMIAGMAITRLKRVNEGLRGSW